MERFVEFPEERPEKEKLPKLPMLRIEPTTRCNLDCVYCKRKKMIDDGEIKVQDIDLNMVKGALEKIDGNVEKIIYQGWGEPMLCKSLPDLLDMARGVGAKTGIITNGTIIREEVFNRCDDVIVSIDSLNQNYKARGNSAKVVENISKIRELYPDLPIAFNIVVSKENAGRLEDLFIFARRIKAKIILIPQIGNAFEPADESDIEKIKVLISKYPDIIAGKFSPNEKNSTNNIPMVYMDSCGKVNVGDHNLGGAEDLGKIVAKLTRESLRKSAN